MRVGMEWGLDGLAETAELLVAELVTNAVQAMVRQEDHTAVGLRLFGGNCASPHRGLGCRPAAAASQMLRRGWHTRPQRRGRAWAVPGSGAERVLGFGISRRNPPARLSRASLRSNSPNFLKSAADRLRSRSCRGGYPSGAGTTGRGDERPGYSAPDSGRTPRSERLLSRLVIQPARFSR